jgi:hypothetical protein
MLQIFANQKSQFWYFWQGVGMENVGLFYGNLVPFELFGIFHGRLVYFVGMWYTFTILVYFRKKNLATLQHEHRYHPPP